MNRCPSRNAPTAASKATAPSSASTSAGPKANWAGMTPTPANTSRRWKTQRPEYGSWKTNSANCAANDHLKQPARQSRPSFSSRKRATGGTFEFTFKLPKSANHGNTQPRNPRRKANPKPAKAKIRNPPNVRKDERTYQDRRTYELAPSAKIRADALAKSMCVNRRQPAISGQTRCPTCVEKHRQGNRRPTGSTKWARRTCRHG